MHLTECFWQPPPQCARLGTGDIHVWRIELGQPEHVYQRLRQHLDVDELKRVDRYPFQVDGRRFAACRGALRELLSAYVGIPPSELRFSYSPSGKPMMADALFGRGLDFNLSHSHGMALIAVARGGESGELGIDLERVRSLSDLDGLVALCLSPREQMEFKTVSSGLRSAAFFNCWTRKEAFTKATGEGLSRPLDQLEVAFLPGDRAVLRAVAGSVLDVEDWSLLELPPLPGYVGALAARGRGQDVSCWIWDCSFPAESLVRGVGRFDGAGVFRSNTVS